MATKIIDPDKASNYTIAGKAFKTKQAVINCCREILKSTPYGSHVDQDDFDFLMSVFSHHTEWPQKRGSGITTITTNETGHGTSCFWLVRQDQSVIDISFVHAVKHLPCKRQKALMPQPLIDFKNGARQAIKDQVEAFRRNNVADAKENADVDHVYPKTFDALLFSFCIHHHVNPLTVSVIEREGCLHHITDDMVRMSWATYHQENAELRIVSKAENLSAPKAKVDWALTWQQTDHA